MKPMYQDFYLDNGNELTETKHGFEKRGLQDLADGTIGLGKFVRGPFYVDRKQIRLLTPQYA